MASEACGTCGAVGEWRLSIHPRLYCSRDCYEAAMVKRGLAMTPRPK